MPEPLTVTDALTKTYGKMLTERSLPAEKIKEIPVGDVLKRAKADYPNVKFSESKSIVYDVQKKLLPKVAAPTPTGKPTSPSTAKVSAPTDTAPSYSPQQLAAQAPSFTEQDCADLYAAPLEVILLAFNSSREPDEFITEDKVKAQGKRLYRLLVKYGVKELPLAELMFGMFLVGDYGPVVRDVILNRGKKEPPRQPTPAPEPSGAPVTSAMQPQVEGRTYTDQEVKDMLSGKHLKAP